MRGNKKPEQPFRETHSAPRVHTVRIGPMVSIPATLRSLGYEPGPILLSSGFNLAQFEDSDIRISYTPQANCWRAAPLQQDASTSDYWWASVLFLPTSALRGTWSVAHRMCILRFAALSSILICMIKAACLHLPPAVTVPCSAMLSTCQGWQALTKYTTWRSPLPATSCIPSVAGTGTPPRCT